MPVSAPQLQAPMILDEEQHHLHHHHFKFKDVFRRKENDCNQGADIPEGQTEVQSIVQISPFHRVPEEIILEITDKLDLCSKLILTYTCRLFSQILDVSIGDIFPTDHDLSRLISGENEQQLKIRALEQFNFFCTRERTNERSTRKLVCCDYKRSHDVSFFTANALQPESLKRKCIGHEGRVWICPHRVWNHAQVRQLIEKPGRRLSKAHINPCECPLHVSIVDGRDIHVRYFLRKVNESQTYVNEMLAEDATEKARIPLCPHKRSDDPDVIASVEEGCGPLDSEEGHGGLQCQTCKTLISFGRSWAKNPHFEVRTHRDAGSFGKIRQVNDPKWVRQLTMPPEFDSLVNEWDRNIGKYPVEFSRFYSATFALP